MTLGDLYDALNGLRAAEIERDRAKNQFEHDEYSMRNDAKRAYYQRRVDHVRALRSQPIFLTTKPDGEANGKLLAEHEDLHEVRR